MQPISQAAPFICNRAISFRPLSLPALEKVDLRHAQISARILVGILSRSALADGRHVSGYVFLREVRGRGRRYGAGSKDRRNLIALAAGLPPTETNPERGKSFNADGVKVVGSVFLCQGFTAEGEVRLVGAQIGGDLGCDGGSFKNPGDDALSADGAHVGGSVFLNQGFAADGAVRLPGAKIMQQSEPFGRHIQEHRQHCAHRGPCIT